MAQVRRWCWKNPAMPDRTAACSGARIIRFAICLAQAHAYRCEENKAPARYFSTAVEELLSLPFLQRNRMADTLHAYQSATTGQFVTCMARSCAVGQALEAADPTRLARSIIMTPLARMNRPAQQGEDTST